MNKTTTESQISYNIPRIMLAAPKSGSGKTMLTCGLIKALMNRCLSLATYKCGPDYIDPMFHRSVLKLPGGNLDSFFLDKEALKQTFVDCTFGEKQADFAIIEGVMGYYDGLGGMSEKASSYEVSKYLDVPVILVVDAKGASVSLAAVIKGMLSYREDHKIAGVILNQVSASYYDRIAKVIEDECQIPVLGYVEKLTEAEVLSRHLGLVAPEEVDGFLEKMDVLANKMEATVRIDDIIEIAKNSTEVYINQKSERTEKTFQDQKITSHSSILCTSTSTTTNKAVTKGKNITIAVARDEAFSFYYAENLKCLQKAGATLAYFSPLCDKALPKDTAGILLGGGYPENFAKELSENEEMKQAILRAYQDGMPIVAECGGFLYLQKSLESAVDGNVYPMVRILQGDGTKQKGLKRFGYLTCTFAKGGLLGNRDLSIKGHEFHRWDSSDNGTDAIACKPMVETSYPCMVHEANLCAGFLHLYYPSNPDVVDNLVSACVAYQAKKDSFAHWEQIAKPLGSLGLLEHAVMQLASIQKTDQVSIKRKAVLTFSGDHGVVCEGVTQTDSSVTKVVTDNFAKQKSSVNQLSNYAGATVFTFDVGMDCDPYEQDEVVTGCVIHRKVKRGTNNLYKEAAMSVDECKKAIQVGIDAVGALKDQYDIFAIGEMGIGNTTPTAVLTAAFLNLDAKSVTGKGAGLSSGGLHKKEIVVDAAVKRIKEKNLTDPIEILAEGGGFEIAAMVGAFLGGVIHEKAIVMDGCICSLAAFIATQIDARVTQYSLASHVSKEPTGELLLRAMKKEAIIHGQMCLGEGTGAVCLFPLLDMGLCVYDSMGTFADYEIDAYERLK